MRRRLTPLAAASLAVVLCSTAASADPVYPVESFTYWTDSPRRDAQDRPLGQYNFEEGIAGAARRALQRYPSRYGPGADWARELQVAFDSLLHNRPRAPYSHWGDVGHPAYEPDWDQDGVFGDSGGTSPSGIGDFDADTDETMDTAYFRIPCYVAADSWLPHHLTTGGACDTTDAGGPYALGVAHEVRVVDARGLVLDATLWIPGSAFAGSGCPAPGDPLYGERARWASCVNAANLGGARFPGVVFSNGLSSRQEHYQWFAERIAGRGYIVLTFDPAGQGESEGNGGDTFGFSDPAAPDCEFAGACRDTQDVTRWFTGAPITVAQDNGFRFVPRADPATNLPNPLLGVLDTAHVALAGNSMGAISTLHYLRSLADGDGADGRPLPPVVAAISLSGATESRAIVPIQFQTSDFDGSPALVGPTAFGVNLGSDGDGIGYKLIKERYDLLRAGTDPAPLSLVVLEGGVHTDHVAVPFVTRTLWATSLAGDYAQDWLDCHVKADAGACAGARTARPHLSRAFASEQDPDGPAGLSPSRCISVPTEASLNQEPDDFLSAETGTPVYDCAP